MATLVKNKKATLNYELLETFEAGMELFGFEVKSLRLGNMTLDGSHITIRGGEAYLIGATIPPYQPANTPTSYEQDRHRKLLLKKKEIATLMGLEKQKGLTIVPISVYNKGPKLKLQIAVARGKKKFDKREVIKKRDAMRSIDRTMKER